MLNSEKEMNHEKWAGYVETQKSSGLPQKKWCAANQVNHHNFRYWRQRLKKESAVKEGDPTDKSAENVEGSEIFEYFGCKNQPVRRCVSPSPDSGFKRFGIVPTGYLRIFSVDSVEFPHGAIMLLVNILNFDAV